MERNSMIVLLGIPIPSTNPLFLAVVSIHILFGLAAIVTGATTMVLHKGRGGTGYVRGVGFWPLGGLQWRPNIQFKSASNFSGWCKTYIPADTTTKMTSASRM
jgi:hypothetical protein